MVRPGEEEGGERGRIGGGSLSPNPLSVKSVNRELSCAAPKT